MKKILFLMVTMIFLCACATAPVPPQQHELIVTVKGAEEGAKVSVENKDRAQVQYAMELPYQDGSLSPMSFISNGMAFTKIFSGLTVGDVTSLWNDLCVLENATEVRKINLFINSPGGDAFQGLALADHIKRAQRKGFHITAHASGVIASAAVPVFAVCDRRLAAPGTIFMIHEPSLWKWPGREDASDIRAQGQLMDLLQTRYRTILVESSKLPLQKWKLLEAETTWFNAEQAKKWGLVDEIE